jgi:hypothetical protein
MRMNETGGTHFSNNLGFFEVLGVIQLVYKIRKSHKPRVIFPSIPHYLKMYQFGKLVEYNSTTPKPTLPASLNIDKCKLKIIQPSGQISKDTILFANDAMTRNVKTYPKQGVLIQTLEMIDQILRSV